MKLEIDTTNKLITILDNTSILELINFLKEKELDSYEIKSVTKYEIVENPIEYIPKMIDPHDYLKPPYIVTCATYTNER